MGGDTTNFFWFLTFFTVQQKEPKPLIINSCGFCQIWSETLYTPQIQRPLPCSSSQHHNGRPTSYLAVNLLTVIPDAGCRFKNFSTTFYSQHGLDAIAHLEVGRVILGASLEDPTPICGARLVSNGRGRLSIKLRLIWLCMICFCRKYLF